MFLNGTSFLLFIRHEFVKQNIYILKEDLGLFATSFIFSCVFSYYLFRKKRFQIMRQNIYRDPDDLRILVIAYSVISFFIFITAVITIS